MTDIIEAELPVRTVLPLLVKTGKRIERAEGAVKVNLAASTRVVFSGDSMTLKLNVEGGEVLSALATITIPGKLDIGQVRLSETANVHQGSITFSHSALADYSGDLRIEARFDVRLPSGKVEHGFAATAVAFEKKTPLEFTGTFRELIEAGSLVVEADARVSEPGAYFLRGLLFDDRGEPIAYAKVERRFEDPSQIVPVRFVFFGKVLVDHQRGGKYTFKNISGYRFDPTDARDRAWLKGPLAPFVTKSHALSEFSSAVWNDDEKRQRLAMLESLKWGTEPE
jgi:hypothetical protein